MTGRILLVDDDEGGREVGAFNLRRAGHTVDEAGDGDRALEAFDPPGHDLVITDLRMPGMSGLELLATLHRRAPDCPVLVITAFGTVGTAVEAMKLGAYDYLEKPFSRDRLLVAASKALEWRRLRQENREKRVRAARVERPLIWSSGMMDEVVSLVDRAVRSDVTVLIVGETGTGKELLARRLHVKSPRAEGPFVAVNCAGIPSGLLESTLFGHVKGAFSGAISPREGVFRKASGGTIFLDEVAEIPINLQAKLLRVLQEKVVDPVGADRQVEVDLRVVSATNRSLQELVREGSFREDLLYRLDVLRVEVPPLRERPEDIQALAVHFVRGLSGADELEVPPQVLGALSERSWPGNVRELENACARMVALAEAGSLSAEDLPGAAGPRAARGTGSTEEQLVGRGAGDPSADLLEGWPPLPEGGLSLESLERSLFARVLELKGGNVTQAAVYLGVPRHVLAYRMEKYGIKRRP